MCDPVSITVGAISLAGGAVNAVGPARANPANDREAQKAFRQNVNDLDARAAEERVAALAQQNAVDRQAQSSAALARVAAAEAGVTGNSVAAQQQSIEADQGRANEAINQNLDATLRQIERMKRGQLSTLQGRENAVQGPSALGVGVQLAGIGADAFTQFLIRRSPKVG
jgi:hypothetical protein